MMEYQNDIVLDLPATLKRRVARETGVIGLGVYPVTNGMDMAVKYGIQYGGSAWDISLSAELVERLGLGAMINAVGGYFRLHAFSMDPYNATFVCLTGDDDLMGAVEYGFAEYRGGHEPFPEGALQLPSHLQRWYDNSDVDDESWMDYIDAYVDQQVEKLWPAHMERVANGFWSFLMRLAAFQERTPEPVAVSIATQEEIRAEKCKADAESLAFYQNVERQRQKLVDTSMRYHR